MKTKKDPANIETMDYPFGSPSHCNSCKHFEGFGICPAYPEGIPVAIVVNDIRHDEVLEGQEGDYIYIKA